MATNWLKPHPHPVLEGRTHLAGVLKLYFPNEEALIVCPLELRNHKF